MPAKSPAPTPPHPDATTELQALTIRAASAAAVWSEAYAEYVLVPANSFAFSTVREAHDVAKKATLDAGAALAKALRQTLKRAESPALTDYTRHALKRLRETTSPGLKVGGRIGDELVEMGYAEHIGLGVYRVTGAGRMVRL